MMAASNDLEEQSGVGRGSIYLNLPSPCTGVKSATYTDWRCTNCICWICCKFNVFLFTGSIFLSFRLAVNIINLHMFLLGMWDERERTAETYFFLKVLHQRFLFTVATILVDPNCAVIFASTFTSKRS